MSMDICSSNNHGEIAYEDRHCPACDRIDELKDEIVDLRDAVRSLEAEVKGLQEIAEAQP